LLVVSSDLSHYPPYSIANEVDNRTIKAILSGKSEVFEKAVKEIKEENYPGLQTAACGQTPILIALKVAERLKIDDFRKIKYQNSGKMSLEKKQVVGYGAIGAWEKTDSSFLDKEASSIALKISRKTLETHLKGKGFESVPKNPSLLKPLGAFVTLKNQGQLRGCIGEFEPDEPLYRVIQKMSIAAATEDPRFPKVGFEELGEIEIEISVIGPRKKIDDWQKIKLGQEGVALQYGPRAGTFLPQVALETGWSLEEFLSQLCQQKAGLPPHCYKSPEVSLYVFEVQILEEK
jgi:hypothetical protein